MLSPHDEVSSTKELLDVIRNGNVQANGAPNFSTRSIGVVKPKFRLSKVSPFKEAVSIGVELCYDDIRIVKLSRSGQKWRLLGYMRVPVNPDASLGTIEFAGRLKSALIEIYGSTKKASVWCNISFSLVEVHHIKIPKVSKKDVANAVYWTIKKEFRLNEADTIFDFDVIEEVIEKDIPKLSVIAYTAPKQRLEEIKKVFQQIGFPLTGISTPPFAIQNLFRTEWTQIFDNTIAVLHIGYNWSAIDIFSRGSLVLTRSIKSGINSIAETFREKIEEIKTNIGADTKELIDMEQARNILFSFDSNPDVLKNIGIALSKEEILNVAVPAINRLVRQLERTFEHYTVTLENETVTKLYIKSSKISSNKLIMDYIAEQLGIDKDVIDPFTSNKVSTPPDLSLPQLISERSPFLVAVGLALSDTIRTFNLIVTHKDKDKEAKIKLIKRCGLATFAFIFVICFGFFLHTQDAVNRKKAKIAQFEQELLQYGFNVDQNIIKKMAVKVKKNRENLKKYSDKFLGMAVISELCAITPANVYFLGLEANFGDIHRNAGFSKNTLVEGIIVGERQMLEAHLAKYMIILENSPIFDAPNIRKSEVGKDRHGDILRFALQLEIVENEVKAQI